MKKTEHNQGACIIAKKSKKPVYLIHGKNDCVIDRRISINARRFNPNTYLKIIKNCGHGCIFEKTDIITNYIKEALHKFKNYYPIDSTSRSIRDTCPKYHKKTENTLDCPYTSQYFIDCYES